MKFVLFSLLLLFSSFIYWSPNEITVDKREKSLDFSKKYPKVKFITFCCESNLEKYESYYCSRKNDLGLSQNKKLRSIGVWYMNIDKFFTQAHLPQVERFTIYGELIDDREISIFEAMPNLKTLVLEAWNLHNRNLERILQHCTHLKIFKIYLSEYHEQLTDETLATLANFSHLEELIMSVSPEVNDPQMIQQTLSDSLPHTKVTIIENIRNPD